MVQSPIMLVFHGGRGATAGVTAMFHALLTQPMAVPVPDAFCVDVGCGYLSFKKACEGAFELYALHPAGQPAPHPIIFWSGFLSPPPEGHATLPKFESLLQRRRK